MKHRSILLSALCVAVLFSALALRADSQSSDEKAIRVLSERFGAAVKARDITKVMSLYVPDESLFVFDAVPPRQYVGAKAYRKDYEEFLGLFPGPIQYGVSDLSVQAAGTLGYSHRIDTWTLTDKAGKRTTLVFRVTDVFRKINGRWLIVHEHLSFPVDPATGKADLLSKP